MVAAARAAVDAAELLASDPRPILDLLADVVRSGQESTGRPSPERGPDAPRIERITVRPADPSGAGEHGPAGSL